MDEILPVAVRRAGEAVGALVRPARERVVPVAKAVGRAGAAVGGASVAGGRGIVDAALHGEGRGEEQEQEAERQEPTGRTRRRTTSSRSAGSSTG